MINTLTSRRGDSLCCDPGEIIVMWAYNTKWYPLPIFKIFTWLYKTLIAAQGSFESEKKQFWLLNYSRPYEIHIWQGFSKFRQFGPTIKLNLEGAVRQTVDTRSTSGLPLKSVGYDGSNGLCGRSVASKLSEHRFDTFFPSYLLITKLLNYTYHAWRS